MKSNINRLFPTKHVILQLFQLLKFSDVPKIFHDLRLYYRAFLGITKHTYIQLTYWAL